MKETVRRRITRTASVMIILVLLIGGTIYLRTISNAESLDNRNLRELSRIGQGVEGRVNNLRRVLNSLEKDSNKKLVEGAKLIPHLSVDTTQVLENDTIENLTAGKTAFKTDVTTSSLKLWHKSENESSEDNPPFRADYSFESLQPTLSSEFMETIFLANENGSIFIWETSRSGVRIHELAALDTLYFKDKRETKGIGKSDILSISVAGQNYRLYLHPVRVHFSKIDDHKVSDSEYTKWILGGMVPQTEYRQQSLSLDPNMALFLSFLVIAGFLLVPFVRIFTMGPKERLKVGNLLYLVIALIFGTGLAGLWLADVVHFSPFKMDIKDQLKETADKVVLNIDSELHIAIEELEKKTDSLNILEASWDREKADSTLLDSIRMKDKFPFDSSGTYPFYHMVFWTDSDGEQIAKWTPRSKNTPRINVDKREYFQAIRQDGGWTQKFHTKPNTTTCENLEDTKTGKLPYYIESIRSWTTGENLAAISLPRVNKNNIYEKNDGISAITTELASLTNPVLPAGVGLAVVNADAQTLFHTRPERILDENFAEETSNGYLLRSVLAARSCKELELHYEGKSMLMVIRPLNERPLFLILFKDMALVDTVRFEAWFEGGVLFGIWVVMILLLILILELLPSSRMDWLWPDLKNPGKYTVFTLYSFPFILFFTTQALTEEHLHIHPTTLVIPMLYLGLGLVIFSHGLPSASSGNKSKIGWALFVLSIPLFGWLTFQFGYEATLYEFMAIFLSLIVILIWLKNPRLQMYINRWSKDLSPRGVYTAAMVSGLLVLGLLPGYLTYRFTFNDHSEHLVKYHQLQLAESLRNRQARIDATVQSTWNMNWQEFQVHLPDTFNHNYDLAYKNLIFRTSLQKEILPHEEHDNQEDNNDPKSDLHNTMHNLLGDHIPFLTEASVRMRQLSSEQADRRWSSVHDTLQLAYGDGEYLTSQLPIARSWLKPVRLAILLAVGGFLSLIVYRVGRWVFFVHLEHSDPLTLEDVLPKPGESWRSTILIGTRSISRQPLFNRSPEIQYIDLITDVDNPGDIRKLLNEPFSDETKVLCLDHFDHRIDEKERNCAILELLEKNVTPNHALPILLLTSRNPDESLLTANIEEANREEMKHRWDRVFGRFSKMILSDYVSEKPFKTLLRLRIIQKITDDLDQLLYDLNTILRKGSPADYKQIFNESLAELALKTDWLREELQHQASAASTLTPNQQAMAGNIKKTLEKTQQEIENLKYTLKKEKSITKKQNMWLNKLTDSAGDLQVLIVQIIQGQDREKPLVKTEQESTGPSPLQFFKKVSIWFLTDAVIEAERVVYRDKRRIRRVIDTLLMECGQHERLQEIGEQLLSRPDWHTLTKKEIIDLVREGAEAHYRARWAILSQGEQLIAAQLSRGAVVNPKSHQAISRLFARGLIRRSPELRLDNASFSGFVKSTVTEDQLHNWERAGIPSTWEMIRAPLVIALIIVALFLFWSQREFLGNTIAFLGTIGVGVGAIFNLLSKLGHVTGTPGLKTSEK